MGPLPEYSPVGVDLSLIRWFLDLTPAERLAFLEDRTADILRIRALQRGQAERKLARAPIQTYDVDIVYSRAPENVGRLLAVLSSMDAATGWHTMTCSRTRS